MNTPNRMAEAATSYAAKSWHVLPVHTCADGACSCGKNTCYHAGKHPRTRRGVHDATTDVLKIKRWWHSWPDANVGIATGSVSGLVVIDLDNKNGKSGEENFRALADKHGGMPSTMTVVTGNGLHLYFRHSGVGIKSSTSKLAVGVDVRADSGYVVAPPSIHESGRRYALQDDHEVLDLPQWLEEQITSSSVRGQTEDNEAGVGLLQEKGDVLEGQRDDTLTRRAFSMRVRQGKSEDEIERLILEFNRTRCKPPLAEAEIREMVRRTCAKYPPRKPEKSQRRQEGNPLYWFKLNTRELTGDPHLASLADYQLGWYIRLRGFAWSNGGFLDDDETVLRRLAQADCAEKFNAEYRRVLRDFEAFENSQGEKLLVNQRMAEEHVQALAKWQQKVAAGEARRR